MGSFSYRAAPLLSLSLPLSRKNRRDSCRALQRLWIAQKTAHHSLLLYASHRAVFLGPVLCTICRRKGARRRTSVFLGRWERPGGERRKKTRVRGLRGAENVARRLDVETAWSQLDCAIKFSFQERRRVDRKSNSRIGYD